MATLGPREVKLSCMRALDYNEFDTPGIKKKTTYDLTVPI